MGYQFFYFIIASAITQRALCATIQPFTLADVQLDDASDFAENAALTHEYLLLLDPDNLLFNFRTTAGLPAPGQSYGGWEGPGVEVRGQFIGHYLSALAFAYKSTGNSAFMERSNTVVAGLKACQAVYGDGYLAAFPKSFIDRLEALQVVWAPLYVIHKIMAGLLDQHQLAGQPQALGVVVGMANYFCGRFQKFVATSGRDHWDKVLETEFGGMNDILYKLYMETGTPAYSDCAHLFDKPVWFNAMVEGRDTLGGLHANTHLAQINGFASRFEATGDKQAWVAVANFFTSVLSNHSFSTGGSNWFEFWHDPRTLADAVTKADSGANTEESCTQYNILKIARALFRWSGDAAVADFYERAILNGVLGIQRRPHSHSHSASTADDHHQHSPAPLPRGMRLPDTGNAASQAAGRSPVLTGAMPAGLAQSYGPSIEEAVVMPHALSPAEAAAVAATNAAHQGEHGRPANPKIVSWTDDPAAGLKASIQATTDQFAPGVYIYYMPLASGLWRGDNGHVWTHGWGDRWNTFWCCYGTAVESFSKLADSIYFYSLPNGVAAHRPIGSGSDGVAADHALEGADSASTAAEEDVLTRVSFKSAAVDPAGVDGLHAQSDRAGADPVPSRLPQLFVNQLVSSTLRWRQLGVKVTQHAELYSTKDNVARSTLTFALDPPPSSTAGAGGDGGGGNVTTGDSDGQGARASFTLRWRIPSWTDAKDVELKLDGRAIDVSQLRSSRSSGAGGGLRFSSPRFGQGSAFVALGPDFKDGSVLEAAMPMRIATEDISDGRPNFQSLKAIMMGPHHMAGLTTDNVSTVNVDPSAIQRAISIPSTAELVSLAKADNASELLQRGGGAQGSMHFAPLLASSRAAAMDATFRIVPGLAGAAIAEGGGQQRVISLESMHLPGQYLTHDGAGGLVLQYHSLEAGENPVGRGAATFAVHGDLRAPGATRGGAASASAAEAGGGGAVVELEPLDSAGRKMQVRAAPPAAAEYPKGARLLSGHARSYLLVPIGQIVDEHYTAYFNFVAAPAAAPSVAQSVIGVGDSGGGSVADLE